MARDPSYHDWPPAIRLFHPFHGDALDVAQVIEDLDIEPFRITLDEWTIVPHMEAIQAEWLAMQMLPTMSATEEPRDTEYDDILALIEREEQFGREKKRSRSLRKGSQTKPTRDIDDGHEKTRGAEDEDIVAVYKKEETEKEQSNPNEEFGPSLQEILEKQQQQYQEFNGPCILCLEPDMESKERLCELREALGEALDHPSYFSPSSIYSWNHTSYGDTGYRPLIPISAFSTVSSALAVARKLKGLWEPLSFEVKDLHVASCREDQEHDDRLSSVRSAESQRVAWGCNAKIMLMGEEVEQDEDWNKKMVEQLLEKGIPGGLDISMDYTILDDEEESTNDIEKWLDDTWDSECASLNISRSSI